GEEGDGAMLLDRHALGDVRDEAALPHARARRDDDQVPPLEAACDRVEVPETRRGPRDLLAGLRHFLEALELALEDLGQVSEVVRVLLVRDLEEEALGVLDEVPRLALV